MDRRGFIAGLGAAGAAMVAKAEATGIVSEELAEAVEHSMLEEMQQGQESSRRRERRKSFLEKEAEVTPLPDKPTLADIFNLRLPKYVFNHNLQSGMNALKRGLDEEVVLACMLHDTGIALGSPDHGYRGAALIRPYVSERTHWAVRYHQALRFYPDPDVGYEYPESYYRSFGKEYKPEPYIQADYDYARNHKWYMSSRYVTMMDEYSFDREAVVTLDPFMEIIGRHFKQPKEGLGWDNTESSYMWRTLIWPHRPL